MYLRIFAKEREEIAKGLAQGQSIRKIGKELSRAPSTISREIHRLLQDRQTYSAMASHLDAQTKQRERSAGKRKISGNLKVLIEECLEKRWSPEQVSGYLKRTHSDPLKHISHEAIYQYIYRQTERKRKILIGCLRHRKRNRGRRKSQYERRGKIKNPTTIHERPKEIEQRVTFGHWEGDLVVGKNHKSAIGTLVERKSRLTKIISLIYGKDSLSVITEFRLAFSKFPKKFKKSLTYDRGLEMALHEQFTLLTEIPVYFADPRAPWQRGTNENTNGLIRGFFPKKTDFSKFMAEELKKVEDLINQRPRKVLGFQTPQEVFEGLYATD